jgi:hypothetical protein
MASRTAKLPVMTQRRPQGGRTARIRTERARQELGYFLQGQVIKRDEARTDVREKIAALARKHGFDVRELVGSGKGRNGAVAASYLLRPPVWR